jgi:NAD(P)-dependent dehydrogenase (short-subunit alcohol dehydrogenase family)
VKGPVTGPGNGSATRAWTLVDMPDLTGTRALVTGVTAGLGTETARELLRAGAEVILVARSAARLETTIVGLTAEVPSAKVHPVLIDLADLSSVRRGAATAAEIGPLNLLVNNAGVMALPYGRTVDGFEMQFGTNHLGPFLLTGLLLPQLVASGQGRVVAVASQAHRIARGVPLGDPRRQKGRYSKWDAYGGSKLANLMFTFELDRRLRAAGLPVTAVVAHPGYSATELVGKSGGIGGSVMTAATGLLGQPADLPGSTYVGPGGFAQMRGYPRVVKARKKAYDEDLQRRLWTLSEEATGICYP